MLINNQNNKSSFRDLLIVKHNTRTRTRTKDAHTLNLPFAHQFRLAYAC